MVTSNHQVLFTSSPDICDILRCEENEEVKGEKIISHRLAQIAGGKVGVVVSFTPSCCV